MLLQDWLKEILINGAAVTQREFQDKGELYC